MVKVLFVCLGNICRSPMAEGIFVHLVEEAGLRDQFEIDSAGTGDWHAGERPDERMLATASAHDIELPSFARQVRSQDLAYYDYIIPMDQSNMRNLQSLFDANPDAKAQMIKMRHFDPEKQNADVPDPYYGGQKGFEKVYAMLYRANENFLQFLTEKHGLV